MYRHACEKKVSAAPDEADSDLLSLKLPNGANAVVAEKLVTADMKSCEEKDRLARINLHQAVADESDSDIDLAGADSLCALHSSACLDVLHIRESLSPEKLFRYVLRSSTDATTLG